VILDASFIKSEERLRAKKLAQEKNADFFIVEYQTMMKIGGIFIMMALKYISPILIKTNSG
jgi:hypothetical protein